MKSSRHDNANLPASFQCRHRPCSSAAAMFSSFQEKLAKDATTIRVSTCLSTSGGMISPTWSFPSFPLQRTPCNEHSVSARQELCCPDPRYVARVSQGHGDDPVRLGRQSTCRLRGMRGLTYRRGSTPATTPTVLVALAARQP